MNEKDFKKRPHDIYLMIFIYLRRKDINPDPIFKKIGISYEDFLTSEPFITDDLSDLIWNEAIKLSEDPYFGLHFGASILDHAHGHILVTLIQHCDNIENALNCFCRYHVVVDDHENKILTDPTENCITLPWIERSRNPLVRKHQAEAYLAMMAEMIDHLSMGAIKPCKVQFGCNRPRDVGPLQRIFDAKLLFNQEIYSISFNRDELKMPIPMSNLDFFKAIETHIQACIKNRFKTNTWRDRVANAIVDNIYSERISIALISRKLAVSSRTLQSRLKEEGATFSQIWDKVRQDIAQYYLIEREEPISEIALLLGFADQSAFTKAFKQWCGQTPLHYRRRPA